MKFLVQDHILYIQVQGRKPFPVMPFDPANPPDHDEMFRKLEIAINSEFASAVAATFRAALLGIDNLPE